MNDTLLLDTLLFKITPEKETTVLANPETCLDRIITAISFQFNTWDIKAS